MSERLLRGLFAALAIAVTVAGQRLMISGGRGPVGGLLVMASGVALFCWSVRGRFAASWAGRLPVANASPTPWLLSAAALFSAGAAAWSVVIARRHGTDYSPAALLWVAGIVALLSAVAAGHDGFEEVWDRARGRRAEIAGIALLSLGAAALRFYRLGAIPAVIDGDEGWIGLLALRPAEGVFANPFASMDNVGGWYIRALAGVIDVLGRNPVSLRFLTALGGALAVPAVVLLGRRLFGLRVGIYAGVLMAVSHAHIHFSRISSVLYILGTLFGSLELYLVVTGVLDRSWRRLALGGLVWGIHFCVYIDAVMMAGALALLLAAGLILCRPRLRPALRLLPAFALGSAVASLPALVWAARNSGDFLARFAVDGSFQSGWLQETAAATGRSIPAILAGRAAHAFLTLVYYPATDFYGIPAPLLGSLTAIFFLLGLALAIARPREPGNLTVAVVLCSLTALIGFFALPPSADSYRMIIVFPAVMICAALGIDGLFGAFGLNLPGRSRSLALAASLLFLPVAAANLHAYFGRFAGRCLFWGDPASRIPSHLGRHLHAVPPDVVVFLLSDEHLRQGANPSLDFLSGDRRVRNWSAPAWMLAPKRDVLLVAAPSRVDELESWARENPGGSLERQYECRKLLFATYRPPAL
ncbi:MAG TPA: glycosyltransferase family 39 protein [Thermoanaerobaculia bacterium]